MIHLFKLFPLVLHTWFENVCNSQRTQYHNPVCSWKNTKGVKLQTRFFSQNDDTHDTGGWKNGDQNLISNYANELLFCEDHVKQRGVFGNCLTTATNLWKKCKFTPAIIQHTNALPSSTISFYKILQDLLDFYELAFVFLYI